MKRTLVFFFILFSVLYVFGQAETKSKFTVRLRHVDYEDRYSQYSVNITEKGFDIRPVWYNFFAPNIGFIPYADITEFKRNQISKKKPENPHKEVFLMLFRIRGEPYELNWENFKQRDQFLELLSRYLPQQMKDADLVVPK